MSVINQVLLNLEKRGASLAEFGVLPDHMQLPRESARARHWGWVAAGVAFAIAVPTGWIAFQATVAAPTYSPVASGAGGAKVASASAGEIHAAWPDERDHAYSRETEVFRLSFELSNPLADSAPHRGTGALKVAAGIGDPLSSAGLLGGTDAESATDKTRVGPAASGRSVASAGAAIVKPTVKRIAVPPEIRKQVRDSTPAPHRDTGAPKVAVGIRDPLSSARRVGRTDAESATDKTRVGPAASGRSVASAGAAIVKPTVKRIALPPEIRKQVREPTPRELADHEYRNAVALLNQDRRDEADAGLRKALNVYPEHHQARQVLVGLLVQGRRLEEAERVLEGGLKLSPAQTGFNLTLARLQAHRGDSARAIATLQNGLKYARSNAEYAAFLATLLQREGKHEEAIEHYRAALRLRPGTGVWWVGLGISLQAANQPAAALDAYRRARAVGNLHPHVAALAEQRERQLQ
jgi:MSHA biogenesis protein MshN